MIKELGLLLLIGTTIGGFYVNNSYDFTKIKIIKQSMIYLIALTAILLVYMNWFVFLVGIVSSLSYGLIQFYALHKYKENKKIVCSANLFIVSLIVQLLIIVVSLVVLEAFQIQLHYHVLDITLFKQFKLNTTYILMITATLLIILKPTSVAVKIILKSYEPKNKNNKKFEGHPKAGALIGMLERYFIFMMLMIGQYSAIGFVLAAKSIARYKKISEDAQFAEYYLLGTLLSSILVITVYLIIFNI